MSTNLIDNYIITKKQPSAVATSPAQKNDDKTSAKRMKPIKPQGHLIKPSIIDAPVDMYQSIAYDMKSLKNGLKGDSNDHQLGKINDLGMKLGGLAIAGFLFTQKPTPKTKWMEFVGFGSFFASMALWPKIALQWPAKVVHGFNAQQKYEDSMGRKKSFFSDPQYLPWDLYSDKEINKIGDRLGVDRDVPNRREFVQEKMKKIAIQNNTMWMLTAGFATPIMSALICSEVEKHLGRIQDKNKNIKIEDSFSNYKEEAKKLNFSHYDKKLEDIFEANKNKPITEDMLRDIGKAMSPTVHFFEKYLPKDLAETFVTDKNTYTINEKSIEYILSNTNAEMTECYSYTEDELKRCIPNKDEVIKLLKDNNFFETELDERGIKTASFKINQLIRIKGDNSGIEEISSTTCQEAGAFLNDGLKLNPGNILNDAKINQMKEIKKPIFDFAKEVQKINEYMYNKLASDQETIHANDWNRTAPKLINIFGITPEEIKKTRNDRLQVQKLMRAKLEDIASDDKKYKRVMKDLAALLQTLDDSIAPQQIENCCHQIDRTYNKLAAELMSKGMYEAANQLIGWKFRLGEIENLKADITNTGRSPRTTATIKARLVEYGLDSDFLKAELQLDNAIDMLKNCKSAKDLENLFNANKLFNVNETGSLKRLKKDFARENRKSVKASFYGLVDTIDLMRRVAKGNFGSSLPNDMKQEVVEEAIEMAIKTVMGGHAADYYNKFYTQRNPTPNATPGHPKIVKGKVVNEYFGKYGKEIEYKGKKIPYATVDLSSDKNFFKNVMTFIFNNDMDSETQDALKGKLLDEIKDFRRNKFLKLGNLDAPFKTGHMVSDIKELNIRAEKGDEEALKILKEISASSETVFKTVGLPFDEMFTKLFNQKFNTTKWLSIFGKGALILTGITLASQFFFGNMPDPKKIKKDGNK